VFSRLLLLRQLSQQLVRNDKKWNGSMRIFIRHRVSFSKPRRACTLVVVMTLHQASFVLAASPVNVVPNLQQQGLPSIRHEESAPNVASQKSNSPEAEPVLADQLLLSPIRQIALKSPLFSAEIKVLLCEFIGKDRVSANALEQVRGQIWDLYRQRGRLVRVALLVIPGEEGDGGSMLQARVDEISVRAVRVEQEGEITLKQSLLDDILASAKADVGGGGVLDLDRLDSRLKRRMALKDVNVRATLIPVDPDHVDVNVLVRAAPLEPVAWLAQYDNDGMPTYGRDRYTVAVSIPGHVLPGDQMDVQALASSGMTYGRFGYELPLVTLGARLNVWGTRLDYRVPLVARGEATALGAGLTSPLYMDNASVWTGTLNYLNKRETGHLANDTPTADKTIHSVQGKVAASYFISQTKSLYLNATLTMGNLDLSALASAAAQDHSSAKTAGTFTRMEWEAGWNWRASFDQSGKWDAGLKVKGQLASKNLDQSEKFALGGPLGVRAYSASEALGDEGYVASADLGYQLISGLRMFGFYDVGRTRLSKQPWALQATAAQYPLQGAGVGLAFARKSLVGSAAYARQIGPNPGLSAAGLDADGSRRRARLILSLMWWM
jgi:hemolysin activation/secretion protein